MPANQAPLGVILAGGRAQRLAGDKAIAPLAGRPLIEWPLAALREALDEVVVVAKRATALPRLDVPVWIEPDEPSHPATGIIHALQRSGDRSVLVCATDLPLLDAVVVRRLAREPAGDALAVVARAGDRTQPLLARYEPAALDSLRASLPDGPMTGAVESKWLDVPAIALTNVNTPADLEQAAQRIARR